jgi:hypothetical protein
LSDENAYSVSVPMPSAGAAPRAPTPATPAMPGRAADRDAPPASVPVHDDPEVKPRGVALVVS